MAKKTEKEVVMLTKTAEVSKEPMSLAMAYLPYTTVLEINIYYCVLNKIAIGDLKDKDLFDVAIKAIIPTPLPFSRWNARWASATLSASTRRSKTCRTPS
jgi:hypothetical protein